jgi:hypothetical protein
MNRRLLLAALAATSLAACGQGKTSSGPRTRIVERDGAFALAVTDGKHTVFVPLPAQAQAMVDGTWVPISPAQVSAGVGIIPRCNCALIDCQPFCRPEAPWWAGPPIDPRGQPRLVP